MVITLICYSSFIHTMIEVVLAVLRTLEQLKLLLL
jgi:hypothetical protein